MVHMLRFFRQRPKVAALLSFCISGVIWWLCSAIGPSAADRVVMDHLARILGASSYSNESIDAEIKALGAKAAVPALMRFIEQQHSAWRDRYEEWYGKAPQRMKRLLPVPTNRHRLVSAAILTLGRLGPAAAPAVRMLVRLYEGPVPALPKRTVYTPLALSVSLSLEQQEIASTLGRIGLAATSAIPALLVSLEPGNRYNGAIASEALLRIDPTGDYTEAALAGLARGRRHARLAAAIASNSVVELNRSVQAKSLVFYWQALEALSCVRSEAPRILPSMIAVLHVENERYRAKAAEALGRLGVVAREAGPELRMLLGDEWLMVRQAATNALIAIEGQTP